MSQTNRGRCHISGQHVFPDCRSLPERHQAAHLSATPTPPLPSPPLPACSGLQAMNSAALRTYGLLMRLQRRAELAAARWLKARLEDTSSGRQATVGPIRVVSWETRWHLSSPPSLIEEDRLPAHHM